MRISRLSKQAIAELTRILRLPKHPIVVYTMLTFVGVGVGFSVIFGMERIRSTLASAEDETVEAVYSEYKSGGDLNYLDPMTGPVKVIVGHGRLLHLDEPVEAVFLGDPGIADVNVVAPDYIYVIGKKLGSTNLIAVSMDAMNAEKNDSNSYLPAPQATKAKLRIDVVSDEHPANHSLRKAMPTAATHVTLFGKRVAVLGKSRRPEEAKAIQDIAQTYSPSGQPPINNTPIDGAQQVNIRVRFAEVSRNDLQTLGIDWQLFNAGKITTAVIDGLLGRNRHHDYSSVNDLINALQRNGVLKVLAEPNLTAMTGEEASFLAGGEVPVPVPQGNQLVTMTYKPYGVSLKFKPTLIRSNRIALYVKPEVSMISNIGSVLSNGNQVPAFTVRRAETTVEIASGQTFAIGGLFQRQMSYTDDKALILGDMPVIGELFMSKRFRRHETELVILITPYLVDPVRDRQLALPSNHPEAPDSPVPQEVVETEVVHEPASSLKDTVEDTKEESSSSAGLYLK